MMLIGCDFHPSWQQVSWLDVETGETGEQKLVASAGWRKGWASPPHPSCSHSRRSPNFTKSVSTHRSYPRSAGLSRASGPSQVASSASSIDLRTSSCADGLVW